MAIQRSVLDRCDLYCPAPTLSGQASYGGVPREVYKLSAYAGVLSLGVTLIAMLAKIAITGSYGMWMWLIPISTTACYAMCLLSATMRRRDAIVVFRESRKLEKKEQRMRRA